MIPARHLYVPALLLCPRAANTRHIVVIKTANVPADFATCEVVTESKPIEVVEVAPVEASIADVTTIPNNCRRRDNQLRFVFLSC
ncbi:hypothetical protein BDR26DRAFT_872286 [Obelidium mucronatum]|nr:hypothetical protein BDR26DRAFT_872286 [Obelidium mucronatum]